MRYTDIPIPAVKGKKSAESKKFSRDAPGYLQSVIEDLHAIDFVKSIEELKPESVSVLAGGNDATTYLILKEGQAAIVKLSTRGLVAEAEALQVWASKSVHTPQVYKHGVLPMTEKSEQKVRYLVEQAMVDAHGRLAETCEQYLRHSPKKARHVGELLGRELTKVHACISDRSFGDYADTGGNTAPYTSWNSYLADYLDTQKDFLLKHGVTNEQIETIHRYIERCKYVSRGRYLHGDFGLRNSAIQPAKERVILFDPNPVIGDPSWDIAILYNNRDYSRRHQEYDKSYTDTARRDKQVLIGFKQGYARQINRGNVLTAQLVQSVLHTSFHEDRVKNAQGNEGAYKARLDSLLGLVERICQEAKRHGA